MRSRPSSPCTQVCTIDPASSLCLGCGRTSAEIGAWLSFSEEQRRTIMAGLPARMQQAGLKPVANRAARK